MANNNMQALLDAGSDAFSNMYDIIFDGFDELPSANVRAKGFEVPEISVETYPVQYHGVTAQRMKPQQTFERKFTIEFRLDSQYGLYEAFMKELGYHINVNTGKTANSTVANGTVTVRALKGDFIASGTNTDILGGRKADAYQDGVDGLFSSSEDLEIWKFKQCSVTKVSQPKFNTETADALSFTVEFIFQDCEFPSGIQS